ncbi:apoptosis-antagonizing transcription factor [Cantharellus anzutake]|uniref:apoptosis-antagonizing transcription factor n=1 Tax=Cantharellus anzutake TaxID=1750568 RepID=UPI00190660B4|nr:apoptosis-antagonizing transcription factor [Cantharellus anzutake]KAF8323481.1 apoptosis-antagonizing transcription factor [Cantharellus anzutake]
MPKLSLAQQISQLADAAPKEIDPEEDYHHDESSDEQEDVVERLRAARSHYVDVGTSAIRKAQGALIDPKYKGVRISRKNVFDDEAEEGDDDESEDEDDDEGEGEGSVAISSLEEGDGSEIGSVFSHSSADNDGGFSEHEGVSDVPGRGASEAQESEGVDPPPTPPNDTSVNSLQEKSDLASMLQHNRNQDRLKGQAILKQLNIWDTFMNARIRLQKGTVVANKLPNPTSISAYLSSEKGKKATEGFLAEAIALSYDLLDLQTALLKDHGVQVPLSKRCKLNDGTSRNEEVTLASEDAAKLQASAHSYLLATLTKWSNKINAVSPATLLPTKKASFRHSGQSSTPKTAVELIQESIEGSVGRAKALGRTRVKRSHGGRIGEAAAGGQAGAGAEGDAEIFDDTDFYQEMVRDVISSKAGKDDLAPDYMERRKEAKARKKIVDTKASKGRKLRYQVHEKLQNFMVPVQPRGLWHEEQIDELFGSLLGRGFGGGRDTESTMDIDQEAGGNDRSGAVEEMSAWMSDLKGLRVF